MKRILSLILALALALPPSMGAVASANAAATSHAFHAFCRGGVPSKEELARRMAASIRAQPNGTRDLERCEANPNQYLYAFQQADPEAGLTTIAQLPAYIRSLVPMRPETNVQYYSSCVRGRTLGTDDVIMNCQPQTIAADVPIYGNPVTGRMTLKLTCANPGIVPVAEDPCAYIRFHVGSPDEVRAHVPIYGGGTSDRCFGYRKVGESTWNDIIPGCPNSPCDMRAVDRVAAPRERSFTGTIENLTPGDYELRVERSAFAENDGARLGVCLENRLGGPRGRRVSSYTPLVRPEDYRMTNGHLIATIAYSDADLPSGVRENDPGGIFFYRTR